MSPATLPLAAGALRSRLQLQSLVETTDPDGTITPVWSTFATVWGDKQGAGLAQQLESDQSAGRRAWEITIRRMSAALPTPMRVLHGDHTLFAIVAVDDETVGDHTVLHCVDGIDMTVAETVTLYRATESVNADRSTSRTWSVIASGVRIRMDEA